jgi:hypothetical protein
MTLAKTEKCAHPICSCMTTSGGYCSVECETMATMPDIACHCEHPACTGDTDRIAPSPSALPS